MPDPLATLEPDTRHFLTQLSETVRSWHAPGMAGQYVDPNARLRPDPVSLDARALAFSILAWGARGAVGRPEGVRIRVITDAYALALAVMSDLDHDEVAVASTIRALQVNEPYRSWIDEKRLPDVIDGVNVPAVVARLAAKGVVVRSAGRLRFDTEAAADRPADY